MFEGLDGERASSAVVAFVAIVLLAGLVLESSSLAPEGGRLGATVAGAVFVCYAAAATVYLLLRDDAEKSA